MTTYTWDEAKRKSNLRKHGLDFADAPAVLERATYTNEDARFLYNERRYTSIGFFNGQEVVVVYAEVNNEVRIISFRKATRHEREIFYGR
jgi:uncharacterized DUF497 family protein